MKPGLALVLGLGLSISMTSAMAEDEDSPFCNCWYEGFEDGLEYNWDNRAFAEDFGVCKKSGNTLAYELGFKTAEKNADRKCSRNPVKRDKGSGSS